MKSENQDYRILSGYGSLLFFLSFLILASQFSCRRVHLIKRIASEKAEVVEFGNGEKVVGFIPMHHIGKPLFYVEVRLLVDSFKKEGFIVYYESAKGDPIDDSLKLDTYLRKLRKMLGLHIDTGGYSKLIPQNPVTNTLVNQPPYHELGVTEQDFRVDIPNNKLVDAYEEKFGAIQLEDADLQIPLGDRYVQSLRLPMKNVKEIIIDHRDLYLAKQIQQSVHKKILVIYGALHMEGTFSQLKSMDKAWQQRKSKKRPVYTHG